MRKGHSRPVTTSNNLTTARVITHQGGVKVYQNGTYIAVEVYTDQDENNVVPQPISALSLSNAGLSGTSSLFLPPGLYRFVLYGPKDTSGPVGLPFEDNVVV